MKYQIIGLTVILLSLQAWALQISPVGFFVSNPKGAAEAIGKNKDLAMTKLEIDTKRELIKLRLFNSKKFFELKNNRLENSPLIQSFLDEVDEAFWGFNQKIDPKKKMDLYNDLMKGKPIDIAKKIAKQQMLMHIQKNWAQLRETIFNENAAESWEHGGRISTLQNLNNSLLYVPQASSQFLFKFGDSFVEVDKKNLQKGQVGVDVNSRLDSNKLSPEADNIIPDDADGKIVKQRAHNATTENNNSATSSSGTNTAASDAVPTAPSVPSAPPPAPPTLPFDPNFNLNNF